MVVFGPSSLTGPPSRRLSKEERRSAEDERSRGDGWADRKQQGCVVGSGLFWRKCHRIPGIILRVGLGGGE